MHESFSDVEREIVRTVERFAEERVRPLVAGYEASGTFPADLVDEMVQLGLFGLAVPEEFGGLGLRLTVFAAVFETLARAWTTLAAYANSHATVAHAIATYGTEDQKRRYLPGLATGEHRGALCLSEPDCGSDLQAIRGTLVPDGEDYRLNASKTYVTNGRRATLLLTLARHPQSDAAGKPRFSLAIVEKACDGVEVTTTFRKMAFGQVDTVQIEMSAVPISSRNILGGDTGIGFRQLMDALEVGRIAIAASAVGLAANAVAEARKFAAERRTFGVAIDQHQAIQLKLADMATRLVAARLITMEAAREKETGKRCDMIGAMAKLFASEVAVKIAQDAVKVHGGAGYIKEYAVERLYREALLYTIGEGTNDINRLVIARRIKDDERGILGLPY
ncbi:acyl-CoA dehydrogenase family protein [Defluviimonas sp. SAOS-178_SWC]|uniref:acyl-CoA dehydrogenase family protein n=1 Tax=Defluviimonas sp. SAOS-178_SWC TaxID=3121287 RepID=UPI0032221260